MRGKQTASRLISLLALIAAMTPVFSQPQLAGASTDDFAFYAVYDGHGGKKAADMAKKCARSFHVTPRRSTSRR